MRNHTSTSFHTLDGDRPNHSLIHKILYYTCNIINNRAPRVTVDSDIKQRKFTCNWESVWNVSPQKASPSRKLSDLFWHSLPWKKIQTELTQVNILDIGCGSGNYSQRIFPHLNNDSTYTGVDVYTNKNWQNLQGDKVHFHMIKGDSIKNFLDHKINFVMSQSAFEHVESDLAYFQDIAKFAQEKMSSTIQVHLLPTPSCLWLYGLHGFRQYNLRNISSITRLFSSFSDCYVFQLGGDKCNKVHMDFIRSPQRKTGVDLRETKTSEYDRALFNAIKEDSVQGRTPAYYALVIHSYPQNKLF